MDTDATARFPARLWLLESFLNSVDATSGQDDLADLDRFTRWLRDHQRDAAAQELTHEQLDWARQLRGHLRQVLQSHHGAAVDLDTDTLTRLTHPLQLRVAFDGTGAPLLAPRGTGVAGFLAELVATVVRAGADGEWERMKLCPADDCAVAYYDTSKNRSKRWCSMQACGNRNKTRTYYQRRTGQKAAGA